MQLIIYLLLFLLCSFSDVEAQYVKEGTLHVEGELGDLPFAVRNDANTALSPDGTKTPFTTNSTGDIWVAAKQAGTWSMSMQPNTPVTFGVTAQVGYGSIGASYAVALAAVATTKVVTIDNQTNGEVWVSMNSGTSDTLNLKAGDRVSFNFGSSGLVYNQAVHIKQGIGTPPSSGTLFIYSYR